MPEADSLNHEDVLDIDHQTVDNVPKMTEPSKAGGYETDAREPIRKTDINKDVTASRL